MAALVSISESEGDGKKSLVLAPPQGDKSLKVLEVKLRIAAEDGRFGSAEVAQDVLEFAALASQPGSLNKAKEVPGLLNKFAGYMIDAVTAYGNSSTLDIWLAEALVCIHNFAGDSRDRLALPIFDAIATIIARNSSELDPDLTDRLIAALVIVSSPACRFTDSLVEFIIEEMRSRQGRMSPVTLEHCLALLGIARSKRLIAEQVGLALAAPRGFMSEVALVMRALVTLADLYALVADLASQSAKIQAEQAGSSISIAWAVAAGAVPNDVQDVDIKVVHECGVPSDASDVRLVMTLLDLHRRNRKIAGGAFRLLATMCRLTKDHLAAILVDESRGLILAQESHVNSRAVNLHATEVVLVAAARPGPNLISGAMMLMVGRALRSFPQDAQIVSAGLHALQLAADDEDQVVSLLEIIPSAELVRIGEGHSANPSAMNSLCNLLKLLSDSDDQIREELVSNGAVAIPFRSMEASLETCVAEGESAEDYCADSCAAAARLVLTLTYLSEDAAFHAAKVDGGGIIMAVLDLYLGNRSVTHAGLLALKNIAHFQTVRRQVLVPEEQETWSVLAKVLYIADLAADKDPDILSQACCAISTLTTVEGDEQKEDMMRNSINQEYLARIIEKVRWHWPRFRGDLNYCLRLMVMAATEPHKTRLLDDKGREVYVIGKGRNDQVAAWDDLESAADEAEEPLSLPEPEVEEPEADRIRGADLQRSRKRIQEKVETAEISIQTDASTTASGDEHVSVASRDSYEKEVDAVLDGLYGSPRDSEKSGGSGILGAVFAEDTRRDSYQRLMGAFGLEDSEEEENNPTKKRAMRRRMHAKAHGFKGKSVPKLGKTSESGWLGGLLTSTPEETDATPKPDENVDEAKEEEPQEDDWFGDWGALFESENEEEDEKPKETEATKENTEKKKTGWFSRGGQDDAQKSEAKKDEEEEEEEEASGWGDLFATDEELEAKEERKAKAKEEKERKAREEAEKKKRLFGGLFG